MLRGWVIPVNIIVSDSIAIIVLNFTSTLTCLYLFTCTGEVMNLRCNIYGWGSSISLTENCSGKSTKTTPSISWSFSAKLQLKCVWKIMVCGMCLFGNSILQWLLWSKVNDRWWENVLRLSNKQQTYIRVLLFIHNAQAYHNERFRKRARCIMFENTCTLSKHSISKILCICE